MYVGMLSHVCCQSLLFIAVEPALHSSHRVYHILSEQREILFTLLGVMKVTFDQLCFLFAFSHIL